jgi:hypothetical protein
LAFTRLLGIAIPATALTQRRGKFLRKQMTTSAVEVKNLEKGEVARGERDVKPQALGF